MTAELVTARAAPRRARQHISYRAVRGGTAVTMVSIYLGILFAVPSNLQFAALGSLGKPAVLWGVLLLGWWMLSQLQWSGRELRTRGTALRVLLAVFAIVVLISYAAALLRGQPADQVGSASSSLVRIASWSGVCLVAADGIRTRDEITQVFRRISIIGGLLVVLGAAQVATGVRLLEWTASIPGLEIDWSVMDSRGGTVRAVGTATHPLEFSSTMTGLLPLAVGYAFVAVQSAGARAWRWCVPPVLMLALLSVSVTRSAMIGIGIVLVVLLPFLPSRVRHIVLLVVAAGAAAVLLALPRIAQTVVTSFLGVAEDPSALSRANALARVPEFTATSPVFGAGWGTFLPRYYIFDNGWVLMLVEVGIAGVVLFALMLITGIGRAMHAASAATSDEGRVIGGAVAASLLVMAVQLALFDGLGFGQFVGTLFLVLGLSVAVGDITGWSRGERSGRASRLPSFSDDQLPPPRTTASARRGVGIDLSPRGPASRTELTS